MTRRTRSKPEKRLTAVSENGENVNLSLSATRAKSGGELAREQGRPRDKRVLRVAELMASRRWETEGLAWRESEGLTKANAESIAAEASRFLRLSGEREVVLDRCLRTLDEWIEEAGRDRVPAMKLLLDLKGLLLERREVTLSGGIDVGRKTDEDLARGAVARREDRELIYRVLREGGYTTEALEALS